MVAQFTLHCNDEDINLNQLTSKRLYWILVGEIRVYRTARLK